MYAHLADYLLEVEHKPDTAHLIYGESGSSVRCPCAAEGCDFVSTEPQSGRRALINAFYREHNVRDYGTNALDMCYA